jgi:cytochrome c oxidase assembly protein subunit 15
MRFHLDMRTYRRLAAVTAVALGVIVLTGGLVRLTASGLGCPDWPRCTDRSYVAAADYHALVEFINRMITVAVAFLIAVAVIGAVILKPRRRDLLLLSCGLVAGYLGQAVLGGLTVIYKLTPPWVIAHFLLSMLLLWNGILLFHRADERFFRGTTYASINPPVVWLARFQVVAAGIVLIAGTVVTGTGPHSGSAHVPRLGFLLSQVAQLHADLALFLTGVVVATTFAVHIADVPRLVRKRVHVLVGIVLAQVAIGFAQYFLSLPRGLVELHIAGATSLWAATLLVLLGLQIPRASSMGLDEDENSLHMAASPGR